MKVYVILEQDGGDYYAITNDSSTYPMHDLDDDGWTLFTDLSYAEEVLKTINTSYPDHDGFRGVVEIEI